MKRSGSGDAASVQRWLTNSAGALGSVLAKTNELVEYTQILRNFLAEPWAEAVRVANLRGDVLVVYCENASALTLLRYRQDDLLAFVRRRICPTCTKVESKVRPR